MRKILGLKIFLILLLCFSSLITFAKPLLLMIGLENRNLYFQDRERLKNYKTVVRYNMETKDVINFAKELNANKILFKYENTAYEYDLKTDNNFKVSSVIPINKFPQESQISIASFPLPGYGIPEYVYPNTNKSYLFGEGKQREQPQSLSKGRRYIKEMAGISMMNTYPTWLENMLVVSNPEVYRSSTSDDGEYSYETARTTSNAVSGVAVIGQWISSFSGTGAVVLDAYLDHKEIQKYNKESQNDARGTPYYYYPNNTYTYYNYTNNTPFASY